MREFFLMVRSMQWIGSVPPQHESTCTSPHSIKPHTFCIWFSLPSVTCLSSLLFLSLNFFPILQPRNHMHTHTVLLPSFSPPFLKILHCCNLRELIKKMAKIKLTSLHRYTCIFQKELWQKPKSLASLSYSLSEEN